MKCYKHNTQDAVSTCQCGHGLCAECSRLYFITTPEGARKVICEDCYNNMHAQDEEQQRQQQDSDKKQAYKDYVKHLILSVWSGFWSVVGFVVFLVYVNSDAAGAWMGLLFLWALGGCPVIIASGSLKTTLTDKIVVGAAFATRNTGQGCTWIIGKILGGALLSAIACPFVCAYSIYKTVQARKNR